MGYNSGRGEYPLTIQGRHQLFRVVQPLRVLKCEQARGVWGHGPPGNF